ncbi:MAG: spermidine/putrescine ABC transporter substrate-binding protein [Pseudomonadota bacterium]
MTDASQSVSRRAVLQMLAAASFAASDRARAAPSLNIYSWPNYFSGNDLAGFARQSGIVPNISNYDSNDILFSKLNSASGAGFDIVIPSSSWIAVLRQHGLLQEIDPARINLSTLAPALLGRPYDPENRYSIPKDWGVLGVVYDPAAVGGEISTWRDFLDASERPGVSGKVRLSSSAWEVIGIALWLQGKDWNAVDADAIRAAGDVLRPFMKHVSSFDALDPNELANGTIVMAQSNQSVARTALMLNPKLHWVVPKPMSEIWVDCYAIARNAPHVDAAYEFLSYQLRPDVQLQETVAIGFPAALAGLRDKVEPGVAHFDMIFGGKNLDIGKLTSFVVNPKTIGVYLQTQLELQAAAD